MKLERHPAVIEEDLPGIYAYIARDNPAAAERLLDAVEATFHEIAANPGCGVLYATRIPAVRGVRMLPVSGFANYLIFYRMEREVVRVIYAVHGARHLPNLFRREQRT